MSSNDSSIDTAPFRFHDLPPENRSAVLLYATIDVVTVDGVLARGCRVQLLLVSRRFKAEYEATVYRHARLTRHSERHRDGRILRGVDDMHLLQHLTLRVPLYYGDAIPFQRKFPAFTKLSNSFRFADHECRNTRGCSKGPARSAFCLADATYGAHTAGARLGRRQVDDRSR